MKTYPGDAPLTDAQKALALEEIRKFAVVIDELSLDEIATVLRPPNGYTSPSTGHTSTANT